MCLSFDTVTGDLLIVSLTWCVTLGKPDMLAEHKCHYVRSLLTCLPNQLRADLQR